MLILTDLHADGKDVMMIRKLIRVLAVATGMLISHTAGAQILLQRNLSIRLALTIAETALAECGDRVSVAVVDRTGRLKVFLQGDNAAPHNIELARRKAYTSQTFGRTSLEWAQRTESSNLSGQRMLTDVITQQGGVPIKFGDETIGGVGLSGAPNGGQQEEACAKAGIAKVADQLKP
jgi:uncharacterized protein GlcG (DUF336 family)